VLRVAALLLAPASAGVVAVLPSTPASAAALPVASFTMTTVDPTATLPVSFDASLSSDPDGIASYTWSFGDGTPTESGITPSHIFVDAGTYSVTLTVTDTGDRSASATLEVTAAPLTVPTAPTFILDTPPSTVVTGTSYSYRFAVSGYPAPTYTLVGAPTWLTVGSASGVVAGTPPFGTTSFAYSVRADDGIGSPATVGPFSVTVKTPPPTGHGYWLVGSDGGIFSFGSAGFHGSTGGMVLQRPVVGLSPTGDRKGYWLVASDGGVFAFGDSGYYGSLPGLGLAPAGTVGRRALAAPIVGIVPSSNGGGYFMVAADGGVFAFGNAKFVGSCPGIGGCVGTAVAVMPDATGNGYWLVTTAGAVYAFGDAAFLGSPSPRSSPVTSAVRTPDGKGYWILFADGTVVPFGDAVGLGDPGGRLGGDRASAVFATADGGGYWVATAAGGVDNYGDAPADGSMAGAHLNGPIVAASGW
jgi:PKD repeat protein